MANTVSRGFIMSKKFVVSFTLLATLVSVTTGCGQLMAQATGGRFINRANVKVVNDSNRKVCAVKVTGADGAVVTDNALAGGPIGIEPGKESVAQIDEKLGKVTLEAYSCEPRKMMLAKQEVDMASPQTMRVH